MSHNINRYRENDLTTQDINHRGRNIIISGIVMLLSFILVSLLINIPQNISIDKTPVNKPTDTQIKPADTDKYLDLYKKAPILNRLDTLNRVYGNLGAQITAALPIPDHINGSLTHPKIYRARCTGTLTNLSHVDLAPYIFYAKPKHKETQADYLLDVFNGLDAKFMTDIHNPKMLSLPYPLKNQKSTAELFNSIEEIPQSCVLRNKYLQIIQAHEKDIRQGIYLPFKVPNTNETLWYLDDKWFVFYQEYNNGNPKLKSFRFNIMPRNIAIISLGQVHNDNNMDDAITDLKATLPNVVSKACACFASSSMIPASFTLVEKSILNQKTRSAAISFQVEFTSEISREELEEKVLKAGGAADVVTS